MTALIDPPEAPPSPAATADRPRRGRPRFAADVRARLATQAGAAPLVPVSCAQAWRGAPFQALDMSALDRFIAIDDQAPSLAAQAGMTIHAALAALAPRGLFLAAVPDDAGMTLGAAIACDAIGFNHAAAGSFGAHVRQVSLARSDSAPLALMADRDDPRFAATLGGMGLTGVIVSAEITLIPIDSAYLEVKAAPVASIRSALAQLQDDDGAEFRVVTLAHGREPRGVFRAMRFLDDGRFRPPGPLNAVATALRGRPKAGVMHYEQALFSARPARLAYRAALPAEAMTEAIPALLDAARRLDAGPTAGDVRLIRAQRSEALVSLAMDGALVSLALPDRAARDTGGLARLDAVVADAGGRVRPGPLGPGGADAFKAMTPDWRALESARDLAIQTPFWARVTGS